MTHNPDEIIISPAGDSTETDILFEPPLSDNLEHDAGLSDDVFENPNVVTPPDQSQVSNTGSSSSLSKQSNGPIHRMPVSRPFIRMPSTIKSPIANYYSEIKWGNGFNQWPLVRFSTQGDGSCLFHAISNSFFRPYHTEMLDGKRIARTQMVHALRRELSEKLSVKVSDDPDSPTYYEQLNRGYTAQWAEDAKIEEYTLKYMQKELNSNAYIGYGYIEFIGNALNKDIYVLEAIRRDIYRQIDEDLELVIKGNRNSIVLYYTDNGHYELVGVQNADGTFDTHFSPDHSLIRFLYGRVQNIIQSVRQNA